MKINLFTSKQFFLFGASIFLGFLVLASVFSIHPPPFLTPNNTSPVSYHAPNTVPERIVKDFSFMKLGFIENRGQVNLPDALFYGSSNGFSYFFTKTSVQVFYRNPETKRLDYLMITFKDNNLVQPQGTDDLGIPLRVLRGSSSIQVHVYQGLQYQNIWDKIDLTFYLTPDGLKYDLILHPGADPSRIQFSIDNSYPVEFTRDSVFIQLPFGKFIDSGLLAYQETTQGKLKVNAGFTLKGESTYGFTVDNVIDESLPVIIDPLLYSTFYGGVGNDEIKDLAFDSSGNIIVIGETDSINFQTTTGGINDTFIGGKDVFIGKFNASGSLVWMTLFGGLIDDYATGLALDSTDNIYFTGYTISSESDFFPIVNAYNGTKGVGLDAYVVKLNNLGDAVLWSTFFGGNRDDIAKDIAVGGNGYVYFTGYTSSSNFPVPGSGGVYQASLQGGSVDNPPVNAFLAILTSSGGYYSSTYYGSNDTYATALVLDSNDLPYVVGYSTSNALPLVSGYSSYSNNTDGFVLHFSAIDLLNIDLSSYVGGSEDDFISSLYFMGSTLFVAGGTYSTDLMTGGVGYNHTFIGGKEAFIMSFDVTSTMTLLSATLLHGSANEEVKSISYDEISKDLVVAGITSSNDFETTTFAFDTTHNGVNDVFISRLNTGLTSLYYSTFIGGSDDDDVNVIAGSVSGEIWFAGRSVSSNFPVTNNAFQATHTLYDAYLSHIIPDALPSLLAINQTINVPAPYESVPIFINVTDDDGVTGVNLVYSTDATGETSIPMQALAVNYYNASIPGFDSATVVSYYFEITDTRGQIAVTNTFTYTVDSPPVIHNVFRTISDPTPSDNVTVYAFITDDVAISSVIIEIEIQGNDTTVFNASMSFDPFSNYYNFTISPQPHLFNVTYRILVNDSVNQWTVSSYYSYTSIEPVITTTTLPSTTTITTDTNTSIITTTSSTSFITPTTPTSNNTEIPSILPSPSTSETSTTSEEAKGFFARLGSTEFFFVFSMTTLLVTLVIMKTRERRI